MTQTEIATTELVLFLGCSGSSPSRHGKLLGICNQSKHAKAHVSTGLGQEPPDEINWCLATSYGERERQGCSTRDERGSPSSSLSEEPCLTEGLSQTTLGGHLRDSLQEFAPCIWLGFLHVQFSISMSLQVIFIAPLQLQILENHLKLLAQFPNGRIPSLLSWSFAKNLAIIRWAERNPEIHTHDSEGLWMWDAAPTQNSDTERELMLENV